MNTINYKHNYHRLFRYRRQLSDSSCSSAHSIVFPSHHFHDFEGLCQIEKVRVAQGLVDSSKGVDGGVARGDRD